VNHRHQKFPAMEQMPQIERTMPLPALLTPIENASFDTSYYIIDKNFLFVATFDTNKATSA
jgi:hypothetical protein